MREIKEKGGMQLKQSRAEQLEQIEVNKKRRQERRNQLLRKMQRRLKNA